MNLRSLLIISFSIMQLSCATAHRIGRVNMGMTKEQVIQTLGTPASVSAQGGTEYLNYSLSETSDNAFYGITSPYYVRLINGRVDSFGRHGDFDSTQTPTVRIENQENIRKDVRIESPPDLYTELKKLNELKKDGIITKEEFETQKKKLLQQN